MLPTIAIIGRPNVGKSTLFNRLTRSRSALVSDFPGLTRDRQYGHGVIGIRPYIIIDTGGITPEHLGPVEKLMAAQTWQAIHEADASLFLVDAKSGLNAADEEILAKLRKTNTHIFLVINKIDSRQAEEVKHEFYALGLKKIYFISAEHGLGVEECINDVLKEVAIIKNLPPIEEPVSLAEDADFDGDAGISATVAAPPETETDRAIKVAIVGRPNVGKSTLINKVLGYERVVVYDQPGTTRDSIFIDFAHGKEKYTLIDTAGVRRKNRTFVPIEKFSVIKTLQAIEEAHVVVLVIDAEENVTDQDLWLLDFITEAGKGLVIAINKWDSIGLPEREMVKKELDRRLTFVNFAKIHFISALRGTGVGVLFSSIRQAYRSATLDLATHDLNKILERALANFEPPLISGRRIRLRYAHAGGKNPPLIVIHGNNVKVPEHYRRYLERTFREALNLVGTPVRLIFRGSRDR